MTKFQAAVAALLVCIAAADAPTAGSAAAPACDRQMVMQIDSARITATANGATIDAFGTSESAGWKEPTVIFAGRTGDTAAVDFVACRPEVSAQVLTPIQTRAEVNFGGPGVRQIVIRAKTNTMTVEMSGP
jgi:hypothetical protein